METEKVGGWQVISVGVCVSCFIFDVMTSLRSSTGIKCDKSEEKDEQR